MIDLREVHLGRLGRFRNGANKLGSIAGATTVIMRMNTFNLKDFVIRSPIVSELENSPKQSRRP